jgi:tRNA(fMet)-specific endonuclease VapC
LTLGTRLVVPAPVLYELRYGASKSAARERNHARVDDFLAAVPEIAGFDEKDAGEAGDIRAFLETLGKPIGPYDMSTAATGLSRRAHADSRRSARKPWPRTQPTAGA